MKTNGTSPTKLFNRLMKLTDENEAFYFSDQEVEVKGKKYLIRSFTYRLATYSDFQDNLDLDSRESRGTAFYTEADKNDWKIFCRAYPKFWNLGEGEPLDAFIKNHTPIVSFEKLDGSLILFGEIDGEIDGEIIAKSKTSINSDQAQMAQDLYEKDEEVKKVVKELLSLNRTPVFELVGPDNVIVLRYDENQLVLLGHVDMDDGEVNPAGNAEQSFYGRCAKMYNKTWDELLEIKETAKPDIEGFVVMVENDFVKVKVNSYVQLHHLKDSVNNVKSLTLLILDDNLDDLIGSFQDDQKTVDYIVETQGKIGHKFNHLITTVEKWVEENKKLDRKEFAIKTRDEFANCFGLAMNLYLGKEPEYKEYFMKHKMYEGL